MQIIVYSFFNTSHEYEIVNWKWIVLIKWMSKMIKKMIKKCINGALFWFIIFFNTLKQPGYKALDTRLRSAEKASFAANLAASRKNEKKLTCMLGGNPDFSLFKGHLISEQI